MRYSLAALALVGAASALSPATPAAAECATSYSGVFEIQVVNVTASKRDITKRGTPLMLTLVDGVLKDAQERIGYIAANNQFQFDNPVQTGTIYDAGWAVCPNNTLVLGPDAIFQECLSGTFYNLYDENSAAQCSSVYIDVIGMSGTAAASEIPDGQVTASAVASQITDGQVQGPTGVVSQITDGQIQGPTGVVSQITDGQIQAPTATGVVSQITDGQIQAPTAVVTQITDGQIQAPTATVAPVTQISDGQIQAPTTFAVVSQISDGQPQVPTNGSTPIRPSVTAYTGAAALPTARGELFGLAAGILAVAML